MSVPDDSDGVLSLALQWRGAWDERPQESLPPEWIRLEIESPEVVEEESTGSERTVMEGESLQGRDVEKDSVETVEKPASPTKSTLISKPTSLRFRLGLLPPTSRSTSSALTVCEATWESSHAPLPSSPSLSHLRSGPASIWFPFIALSFGLSKSLPLYTHNLPSSLYSLAIKDTIPCGILVVLGLLSSSEAPDWETKYDTFEDSRASHNSFLAKQRAMAAERMMPSEQARIARVAREAEERHRFAEDGRARMVRQREREERREREAFASGRLDPRAAAGAGIKWLIGEKILNQGAGVQEAVEGLLIGMIKQEKMAMGVSGILERWREWNDRGGMNREDLAAFGADKVSFCYATCVMSLFRDVCAKEESSVAVDMQECIRFWKKVRIG